MDRLDDPEVKVQAGTRRRTLAVLTMLAALVATGLATAPAGSAAPAAGTSRWAAAPVATIHPGVMTFTPIGQCTANFVFFQGADVYIGQAAHCAGTDGDTAVDGCHSGSLPLGTKVEVDGATRPGTLAYSSWLAMQKAHEQDPTTCYYNDFALVKLDPADAGRVNPSIPFWGGPTGVRRTAGFRPFASTYSLGNSSLRQGLALLQPKLGISLGSDGGGWAHHVLQLLPGIPGDSGSALIDANGRAAGILSTIDVLPHTGGNTFADAGRTLAYARSHGFPNLVLALGTTRFNPNQLPLG